MVAQAFRPARGARQPWPPPPRLRRSAVASAKAEGLRYEVGKVQP